MDITRFSASTVHLDHITTALNCLTPFGGNYDDSNNGLLNNLNNKDNSNNSNSNINNDDVMIYIDPDGLSFIRDYNSVIRIQLLLSRELFVSYSYNNEHDPTRHYDPAQEKADGDDCMKLCVKLSPLLDTINVVNKNQDDVIECTMNYDGYGSMFALILQDSLVEEKVKYSTYMFNEAMRDKDAELLQLQRDAVQFECIIKGDILYNALKDLKELNAKECYIYVKSSSQENDNIFAIIAKSDIGYSKIILPNNRNIIEKLEVMNPMITSDSNLIFDTPIIAYFDFNRFDKIRLSCRIASKVLLRMDMNGILGVNILSQTNNIIVSNKNNEKQTSTNTSKETPLPIDYPGIVIEITMLTKDTLDAVAQQDIETLMDVTLRGRARTRDQNGRDPIAQRSHYLTDNHPTTKPVTNNLLQLSNNVGNTTNDSEAETDDENIQSSRQLDTTEFPFF
ncbi:DNA damage checkpoint control protein Rad17p [Monosporozyma unispora]